MSGWRTFVTVCDAGSLSAAAETLGALLPVGRVAPGRDSRARGRGAAAGAPTSRCAAYGGGKGPAPPRAPRRRRAGPRTRGRPSVGRGRPRRRRARSRALRHQRPGAPRAAAVPRAPCRPPLSAAIWGVRRPRRAGAHRRPGSSGRSSRTTHPDCRSRAELARTPLMHDGDAGVIVPAGHRLAGRRRRVRLAALADDVWAEDEPRLGTAPGAGSQPRRLRAADRAGGR